MPYITWNDSMLVHVDEIDRQHQELFRLINNLHESLLRGEGSHEVKPVLSALIEYVILHFSEEEHLMKEKAYPEYDRHKRYHDNYIAAIKEFTQKYKSNTPLLAREMLLFLGNWARNHVGSADVDIASFIQSMPGNNTPGNGEKPPDH